MPQEPEFQMGGGGLYSTVQDYARFVRALLNELRGVVLAMQAIREVTPRAMLVQTEDLGKTHASASLQYQADFENERRWLSFDLLLGRKTHEAQIYSGQITSERQLEAIREDELAAAAIVLAIILLGGAVINALRYERSERLRR